MTHIPSTRYAIIDPSTTEELDARIYNSISTEDHTFTLTGERVFDQLATRRGERQTRQFVCQVFNHHPLPRGEYHVEATIEGSHEAIRIELVEFNGVKRLEATVVVHE